MRFSFHPFLPAAAALWLSIGSTSAQEFNAAAEKIRDDLETALSELAELRRAIASEKVPLVREISALEDEAREKTDELEQFRRTRDDKDASLSRLRNQVEAIREQNEYTAGLLDEYVTTFETKIDFSEIQLYGPVAEEARLARDDFDMTEAERLVAQIDVIDAAVDRLEKLSGGYRFSGLGLTPSGEIEKGRFAVFGPTVFFASSESDLTGVTYTKANAAEAAIAVPGAKYSIGIRNLIESGEGRIPADATMGKALEISESSESFLEHLGKGRSVGVVILTLGGICFLIGTFKIIEVTRFKTPRPEAVQTVLSHIEAGKMESARTAAADISGAGGDLIRSGVEHAEEKRGILEEILYEKILAVRPKLERLLPFMALTAAAAPLLGLLGTVTGMIKTFNLITIFGTGDAKSLSSGISEALVTTELGLIVAIPALILHGLLARMARQKIGDMEQSAVGFINGVMGFRGRSKEVN